MNNLEDTMLLENEKKEPIYKDVFEEIKKWPKWMQEVYNNEYASANSIKIEIEIETIVDE